MLTPELQVWVWAAGRQRNVKRIIAHEIFVSLLLLSLSTERRHRGLGFFWLPSWTTRNSKLNFQVPICCFSGLCSAFQIKSPELLSFGGATAREAGIVSFFDRFWRWTRRRLANLSDAHEQSPCFIGLSEGLVDSTFAGMVFMMHRRKCRCEPSSLSQQRNWFHFLCSFNDIHSWDVLPIIVANSLADQQKQWACGRWRNGSHRPASAIYAQIWKMWPASRPLEDKPATSRCERYWLAKKSKEECRHRYPDPLSRTLLLLFSYPFLFYFCFSTVAQRHRAINGKFSALTASL